MAGSSESDDVMQNAARVIAWEITRHCDLRCRHCRGGARPVDYEGELTTDECLRVVDGIAACCKPILILTGGEPMSRPDVYDIAGHATQCGLRVVMAPCGHLLTAETATRLKDAGVRAISISIDGATAATHDAFRGVAGAFDRTVAGLRHAIDAGIAFQVNTTVSRTNVDELPAILDLAVAWGAKTLDLFFLVPTGRGASLKEQEITAEEYERALRWALDAAREAPLRIKTTCAPHFARVRRQVAQEQRQVPGYREEAVGTGCMAGQGFVFISHRGILQPCGFLDVPSGDLREVDFDFRRAYEDSTVFTALRARENYGGKCGACEFLRVCGGCRARAYARSGDFLAEEPSCGYIPRRLSGNNEED